VGDAGARLDELERFLVREVLRPARREYYRDAFPTVAADLPPELLDSTVTPSAEGPDSAATAPITVSDQAKMIKTAVDEARHGLKLAAVTSFGDAAIKPVVHETWERRHRSAIGSTVRLILSDAQIALREAVGQIVIKSETCLY
jgi:hypothetical protein